eukprot:CAMPEP_0183753832 /NCGR_PEP_ID=MMETSP0739-20130205/3190_1 /TAXON_ID=385413 /ORGANISM="Thalassiosira miniscula, Strain CCMP1093" /LENGTH=660 /DNA_ID=CAMNT_0025990403 /DNA_START=61 /DNA_END=2043 /DNA_ORIENTATION=-
MSAKGDANDDIASQDQDEVRRKLLKPKISSDEALSILADLYVADGFDVDAEVPRVEVIQELDSYDDVNFLVKIDGEKALLKIHNGVETEYYIAAHARKKAKFNEDDSPSKTVSAGASIIDLHTAIYKHLAAPEYKVKTGTTIIVKRPPSGSDDDNICIRELPVVSSEHSPQHLAIRVQTWIHGTPMSSIKWLPLETLVDSGACLGRMCHALDDLAKSDAAALKASKRYHAWDGRHLMDSKQYISYIDDVERRKLVTSIIDEFEKTIIEGKEGDNFRIGINHGDFNDANIIIGDDMKVAGVIDFGDTVSSWRVLDVSVAMAYALLSSYGQGKRSISAACAMLRGFHHQYPLTLDERKHLRLLVACRLALSAIGGNYTYKQNPENEYILLHAKPAWEALYFIWGKDGQGANGNIAEVVDNAFKLACDNIQVPEGSTIPDFVDISFPDPPIADPLADARGASKNGAKVSSEPVVTFVTGNKKKAEEVRRILSSSGRDLPFTLNNHKIDLPELQGDPVQIAREKCLLAAKKMNGAVITEDTSLCFNALNGLPGVYIKWFLDENGLDGLNDMISFSDDKSAYAQTVVAFCGGPGQDVYTFAGRTQGKIVRPRGSLDFGWDPVFEPDEGKGLTYAEMTGEQKDSISHRKRAFVKLRDYIEEKYVQI